MRDYRVREHILDYFEDEIEVTEQAEVYTIRRGIVRGTEEMVRDGFFLITYESIEHWLYENNYTLECEQWRNFDNYVKIVGQEIAWCIRDFYSEMIKEA